MSDTLFVRPPAEGMGEAVAQRTILRRYNGMWESWQDVAERVSLGNSLLSPIESEREPERELLRKHIAKGIVMMSGRHLQHGDKNQPSRGMETFTNCFDGDTEIPTIEHGIVKIVDVLDQYVTIRCRDGQWRKVQFTYRGNQQTYKYTFASKWGKVGSATVQTVIATENHRWFLEDGTVTENLSIGDCLENAPPEVEYDDEAVLHGLIFGDGSAHKFRVDSTQNYVSQGRDYCAIRVCDKDPVIKQEIMSRFEKLNYKPTYPPHAKGDPVYYLGKKIGWKDLPFTTDSKYIAGFIYGWWLADGYKNEGTGATIISTTRDDAAAWLLRYCVYSGFTTIGHSVKERIEGDGSYSNGKPLHYIRIRHNSRRKVLSKEKLDVRPVYCAEEPVTSGFILANGLVTGNCAHTVASFISFYLLLNGSGVGRCFDDELMVVNWDNAPSLRCVLSDSHPDFDYSAHESERDAIHKYGQGKDTMWYRVPDTREGWAKAFEIWETAAFEKIHRDKMLILVFSDVRKKGSPIGGMQDRPASGPVPLMNAFQKAASLKGSNLDPWLQAMYIDHYFSECVLVGGARRAARMAWKSWRNKSVLKFIEIKRPIEFQGKTVDEVLALRAERAKTGLPPYNSFLWSSNNSVMADEEFWELSSMSSSKIKKLPKEKQELAIHARKVLQKILDCSYADGTGEPGIINQHRLVTKNKGIQKYVDGEYVGSKKFQINDDTRIMLSKLAKKVIKHQYTMGVNPCAEICLLVLGAFCVIGDVVPYHADTLDEAEEGIRATVRALIRTNLMDSIFNREVKRTNRIGVGLTGVHEFAWKFFGFDFLDLLDENKSKDFWDTLARFSKAAQDEAVKYSTLLSVEIPHTVLTVKPSGTISKIHGLTEGWHLPSMAAYLRWVQFRNDDPLVQQYMKAGYPTRVLKTYEGTTIVGFPTAPELTKLGLGTRLVTAAQATPEQQYQWLQLGEKYWLFGGNPPATPRVFDDNVPYGNQISYTLKYDPSKVGFKEFCDLYVKYQQTISCCSVMPQDDTSSYEYQPEESISLEEFERIKANIWAPVTEDIGKEHIDCANGACPVDFKANK